MEVKKRLIINIESSTSHNNLSCYRLKQPFQRTLNYIEYKNKLRRKQL